MEGGDEVPAEWVNDVSEVVIGPSTIGKRVLELGQEISKEYRDMNPILMVVLKGSFMFASDLSRSLSIGHTVEFIRAKSYCGTESTGQVKVEGLESVDLKGRHVLIIEDIVDTGLTLKRLYESFEGAGSASVKCCSFLEKETVRRKEGVPDIDYTAFRIADKFVVGYGLDYNQKYRHLPFVGVYKQDHKE